MRDEAERDEGCLDGVGDGSQSDVAFITLDYAHPFPCINSILIASKSDCAL